MELTGKLVDIALAKAVDKIAEKLQKGKKLTDTETTIILLDGLYKLTQATNKRIDEVKADLTAKINETNRRIDETNKRIDEVKADLTAKINETNKRIDGVRDEVRQLRVELTEVKVELAKLTTQANPQNPNKTPATIR